MGSQAFSAEPYTFTDVVIPQSGSVQLTAKAYAPFPLPMNMVPLIGILPGGGAGMDSVEWAAQRLAANGYIAIIVKPQFGSSVNSYALALKSVFTFASTTSNPYRAITDPNRMGGAGWSLGARALTLVQEEDTRIKAIVAWDNLAAVETGDQGSPSGGFNPSSASFRTPKVPALGLASDATGFSNDPEIKKTAFNWWSQHSIPAMEVVYGKSTHFWWSGRSTLWQQDLSSYYTVNWFDRWLKQDKEASKRLLATVVLETNLTDILSTKYTSAASFDGNRIGNLRQMR